jgi:release factor glutamine methyltransferase
MKMDANVLDWEPHSALFVPDNDPLVFYDAIAELSKEHLGPAGHLYFEIHENLGSAVMNLLKEKGFQPELKKDMQQKERMVRAVKR